MLDKLLNYQFIHSSLEHYFLIILMYWQYNCIAVNNIIVRFNLKSYLVPIDFYIHKFHLPSPVPETRICPRAASVALCMPYYVHSNKHLPPSVSCQTMPSRVTLVPGSHGPRQSGSVIVPTLVPTHTSSMLWKTK